MRVIVIVVLLAILAMSVFFAHDVWTSIDFSDIPPAGYVAMALGIIFSLVIGCGLMALLFYSSRHGYDEAAHVDDKREGE
jgi:hypothetical protein